MENGWMIDLTETLPDGHTPDLTITRPPLNKSEHWCLSPISGHFRGVFHTANNDRFLIKATLFAMSDGFFWAVCIVQGFCAVFTDKSVILGDQHLKTFLASPAISTDRCCRGTFGLLGYSGLIRLDAAGID